MTDLCLWWKSGADGPLSSSPPETDSATAIAQFSDGRTFSILIQVDKGDPSAHRPPTGSSGTNCRSENETPARSLQQTDLLVPSLDNKAVLAAIRHLEENGQLSADWLIDQETPLLDAYSQSGAEGLAAAIALGHPPDERDGLGIPLITHLAEKGDAVALRHLLSAGASPDSCTSTGMTALISAANGGDFEVVRVLLEFGANPHLKNSEGYTAKDRVLASDAEIVGLLDQAGQENPPDAGPQATAHKKHL